MEWHDQGIVLAARPFGEHARIIEVLARERGRCAGLVRGARQPRMRATLQPGNAVRLRWRARLDDQLGAFDLELIHGRAGNLIETGHGAFGLGWLSSLLRLLPEREPNRRLHDVTSLVLDSFAEPAMAAEGAIRLELTFLEEIGFGLDLSACAATGTRENLAYVSPRTGRAVSAAAGAPYAGRLLPLPAFLLAEPDPPPREALVEGFELTGYFLERSVRQLFDRPLPDGRARFVAAVLRRCPEAPERRAGPETGA